MVLYEWTHFKKRQTLKQILAFASSIAGMFMLYQTISILFNTESPVVVVLSGSMKPGFDRGDLLLLSNPPYEQYKPGDIIVYRVHDSETPIVHRILETHNAATSSSDSTEDGGSIGWMLGYGQSAADQLMLTKGDNNRVDDIELYKGLEWLQRKHVIGKVRGILPYVGYISILMTETPQVKYAIFCILALTSLL